MQVLAHSDKLIPVKDVKVPILDIGRPVGHMDDPLSVPPGTNVPTIIGIPDANGKIIGHRPYTGPALDQMQRYGVLPWGVDECIHYGKRTYLGDVIEYRFEEKNIVVRVAVPTKDQVKADRASAKKYNTKQENRLMNPETWDVVSIDKIHR